jgi:Tol biopolymer transport system component
VGRDGVLVRELVEISRLYGKFIWSPDSTRLVFYESGLRVTEPRTGKTWMVAEGMVHTVRWAADSEMLAFSQAPPGSFAYRDTFVAKYDGTGFRNLASTPDEDVGISLSSDGHLAVVSRFVNNVPETVIVNAETGVLVREIATLEAWTAVWSPDGNQFAIVGWSPVSGGLYIVDADTGGTEQIAWGGDPQNLRWLDGDTIEFDSFQGGL